MRVPTPTTLPPAPLLANGLPVPPLASRVPAAAAAFDDDDKGLAVIAALPLAMMAITPSSSHASPPAACLTVMASVLLCSVADFVVFVFSRLN